MPINRRVWIAYDYNCSLEKADEIIKEFDNLPESEKQKYRDFTNAIVERNRENQKASLERFIKNGRKHDTDNNNKSDL